MIAMNLPASTQHHVEDFMVADPGIRLSIRLRNETRREHTLVEAACSLPDSVRNVDDYRRCLVDFYGIFCPLERHIATFTGWEKMGLSMEKCARMPVLRDDLRQLNVDRSLWREAPAHAMPALPMFPFALGALYVLEGSTLGGQEIMATLQKRLLTPAALPGGFFAGRGATTGQLWQQFRKALDAYGDEFPDAQAEVVAGAKRTFDAVAVWFNKKNNGDRHEFR